MFRSAVLAAVLMVSLHGIGLGADEPVTAPAPNELPRHVIRVLRTHNKAQVNRYVPKVYTVNNVNPYSLLRWLRRTAEIEEGGFYFYGKPNGEGVVDSGKVLVILPEYMLPGVDRLMETIDRPNLTSSSGEIFFYHRPKHRHVNDPSFNNLIQAARGNSGTFRTDPEANAFLVYAAASKTDEVERSLEWFDLPPKQVMMEVTVYEISVDNASRIGLDYMAWKSGPGRHLFSAQAFSEYERISTQRNFNPLLNTGTGGAGGTFNLPGSDWEARGSNAVYFLDVPSAFFDFLVVKNKARVMTSSKIIARNQTPASLFAGDTILYYQAQAGPADNAGIRPAGQPIDQFGNFVTVPDNRSVIDSERPRVMGARSGVLLEMTPTIGTEEVQLDILSEVISHTGFDGAGVPELVSREAQTEVTIKSGQEIVLGGYARTVLAERSDKIPILGSLPVIGSLFGQEGTHAERRQIVIVVSTSVVQDFAAMEYDPTKINAAMIKAKALREADTRLPDVPMGFDQWLLDTEN